MQLFSLSTAPKKLWVADSLKKDRGPHHHRVDRRWILFRRLGEQRPVNLGDLFTAAAFSVPFPSIRLGLII